MPQRTSEKAGRRSAQGSTSGRGESATDALSLLRTDHQNVQRLFRQFENAGEGAHQTKQKIAAEIDRELDMHAAIEEEIFYPAVQQEVEQARDLVQEAIEEHRVVKNLLSEIGVLEPDDEQYDAKVKVLQENVEHHIEEEQNEMFPKVASALSSERLMGLGQEMQARKKMLGRSTLSRVINGVSNLIFGNGESSGAAEDESGGVRGERRGAARARSRRGSAAGRANGAASESRGRGSRNQGGERSAAGGARHGRGSAGGRTSGAQARARGGGQNTRGSGQNGRSGGQNPRTGVGNAGRGGAGGRGSRANGLGTSARRRSGASETRSSARGGNQAGAKKRAASRSRAARKQARSQGRPSGEARGSRGKRRGRSTQGRGRSA